MENGFAGAAKLYWLLPMSLVYDTWHIHYQQFAHEYQYGTSYTQSEPLQTQAKYGNPYR
jgi:hypothetical protein